MHGAPTDDKKKKPNKNEKKTEGEKESVKRETRLYSRMLGGVWSNDEKYNPFRDFVEGQFGRVRSSATKG